MNRNWLSALLITITIFISGCSDKSYEKKKKLIQAVNKFYDTIVKEDIDSLYDYFPDNLKQRLPKKKFLVAFNDTSKKDMLNMFNLLPLKKYSIDSIDKLDKNLYEVTVIIYPVDQPENNKDVIDIMRWQYTNGKWDNVSYKNLIANMINEALKKQKDLVKGLIEKKICKNRIQKLIISFWSFYSENNLTYQDFKAVPADQWVSFLEKNKKPAAPSIKICPSGGQYTITYDHIKQNLIFACSKHEKISLPFVFSDTIYKKQKELSQ